MLKLLFIFTLSLLKVSIPQTMSLSCIFVFAPSFIRMDLSIVTSSTLIQFPPEMDENWVRYGLAKLGQISRTKLAEDAVLCVHNTASALNR